MAAIDQYLEARDLLFALADDQVEAARRFRWPQLDTFNFALDFFDVVPPRDRAALRVVSESGEEQRTFGELTERSNQVANLLRGLGVTRGDRVLLMLDNVVPLWESLLAAIKLGAVVIPASTLLRTEDLADRLDRGVVRAVVTSTELTGRFAGLPTTFAGVAVGDAIAGWTPFADAAGEPTTFEPNGPTAATDPLLLYFTSGTTAQPKLVEHTQVSYPVGHLSTMYCLGVKPGDVHLNISSPGWAKHAWSCVFAPWIAEATVLVHQYARFDAAALLDLLARTGVTTLCAPPTVWRMVIQHQLGARPPTLREALSAGEPLNPEIIEQVSAAWGVTVRDFFGQTETTAILGNAPGQRVKPGSVGRPLPGYDVVLLDADGQPADEGEIAVSLDPRPVSLMTGYRDDDGRTEEVTRGGYYRTGDAAARDADGYYTYVGRLDDVFKASDYRISPFELESVLIEHDAVAEAAVVPSPDPLRLAVPKAYVTLAAGVEPTAEVAASVLDHARTRLPPYARIRRIEFSDLPKTISGKIRRVELRAREHDRATATDRRPGEFWEEDLRA
jgi:acetyl-CoA synthetase